MMYVEITSECEVNLMGMCYEEACLLASMIRGAGLEERRTFNGVLQELRREGIG